MSGGHSRLSAGGGRGKGKTVTLLPHLPRHLHQQPDRRLPPARRHHRPHLPRHGPYLAGQGEQQGGLRGTHPPAPGTTRHAHLLPMPPSTSLRAVAEPVSLSSGFGGPGTATCSLPWPLTAPAHRVFAECHGLIPPGPFFSSCVSDGCQADRQAPCMSLEAYAALCRAQGVCSSWRDATGGLCSESGRPLGALASLAHLTPVSVPRLHLSVRQGVPAVWPRTARVLRLQVKPACEVRGHQRAWGSLPPPRSLSLRSRVAPGSWPTPAARPALGPRPSDRTHVDRGS